MKFKPQNADGKAEIAECKLQKDKRFLTPFSPGFRSRSIRATH